MKKIMNTPDIRVVRFDSKDIIVTSPSLHSDLGNETDRLNGGLVQERQSIWD